jgi:hypothetical protein
MQIQQVPHEKRRNGQQFKYDKTKQKKQKKTSYHQSAGLQG